MKLLHTISFVLIVIGGLNWGAVGLFQTNLVEWVFGMGSTANIIYILVGLAAISEIVTHKANCRQCGASRQM